MTIDNFFTKKHDGFDHVTRAILLLLMWACANSIPRFVMDCPLFDAMYRQLGCNPGPNRHEIQTKYLPQLDRLVVKDFRLLPYNNSPSKCRTHEVVLIHVLFDLQMYTNIHICTNFDCMHI